MLLGRWVALTWLPMYTSFFHMYLWEHFGALASKPIEYSAIVPGECSQPERDEEYVQGSLVVMAWSEVFIQPTNPSTWS